MKKLSIIIVICLSNLIAYSQITIEKTIKGQPNVFYSEKYGYMLNEFVDSTNTLNLFDENFKLVKSITLPAIPTKYKIQNPPYYITDHLFNSDDDLEFAYVLYNSSTSDMETVICNENGQIILTQKGIVIIQKINQKYRLIFYDMFKKVSLVSQVIEGYYPCIETCTNVSTTALSKSQSINEVISEPIPNPATKSFEIFYSLNANCTNAFVELYSIDGSLIKIVPIDILKDRVSVSIFELHPGTYFYKIISDNGLHSSKKIIIN